VVNNIENDHVASDDDVPRLLEQFTQFVNKVPASGCVIVGNDNRGSRSSPAKRSPGDDVRDAHRRRLVGDRLRYADSVRVSSSAIAAWSSARSSCTFRARSTCSTRSVRSGGARRGIASTTRQPARAVQGVAAEIRDRRARLTDRRRRLRAPPDGDRADDRSGARVPAGPSGHRRVPPHRYSRTNYLKELFVARCTARIA